MDPGPTHVHPQEIREVTPARDTHMVGQALQEVVRSLLNAYYEPQFSPHSHGFRPHRGCHTGDFLIIAIRRGYSVDNFHRNVCNRGSLP